ncbi:hypothetical protein [Photobacterium sp. GSS17]|uniref:hypothetical protein n=1 Tax=Photobacterium sp. GSS17 TaxID=3020715 RepID=UPI002360076F|nr:hypothetical protein [Photobacterium sp. GSS17]
MNSIRFKRKAMPVISDYRPMYKISLILLILKECSTGGKSSLIRLHLFNWALKDKLRTEQLILSAKNKELTFDVWGMDPTVNFALNHAVENGLVIKISTGYKITNLGEEFLKKFKIKEVFHIYEDFFSIVKKKITQGMVDQIVLRWKNEV